MPPMHASPDGVNRSIAGADVDLGRLFQGRCQIALRVLYRLRQPKSLCEARGNGRGQCAAGAVTTTASYPFCGEARKTRRLDENIDALRSGAMAAFHEHGLRPKGE